MAVIAGGMAITTFQRFALQRNSYLAAVASRVLVDLTNQERSQTSLASLTINPVLTQAAQAKAHDMATKGYFAHTSPEGITPWHWFSSVGYTYVYAGENLAINFSDSSEVDRAWMNSPAHRANIVNGNFTEIGIATEEGVYNGKQTTFVVQLFGRPVARTNTSVPVTTTPKSVIDTQKAATLTPTKAVLGESSVTYSSSIGNLATSPSDLMTLILEIVAGVIIISLIAIVSIESSRKEYKHMIFGILALLMTVALIYFYCTNSISGVLVI